MSTCPPVHLFVSVGWVLGRFTTMHSRSHRVLCVIHYPEFGSGLQSPLGYKFSIRDVHRSSVSPSVNGDILPRRVQTPAQSFPRPQTTLCQPAETLPSRLASSAGLHQHTSAWPLWASHKHTVSCAAASALPTCNARYPQVLLHVRAPQCELRSLVCLGALPVHPQAMDSSPSPVPPRR